MTSKPSTRKPRLASVPIIEASDQQAPEVAETGEYRNLPLSQLTVNPRNGRKTLRGIEDLAATIRDVGVIEPLIVRPRDGDMFQVCFGHRRLAAAKLAGLSVVPCRIKDLDDVQVLKEGLIENVHRDDLTYLEEAEQLAELMELKSFTVKDLAQDLGQSPTHIKQRLSLLTLPGKARAALDSALITYGTALALTEIADYPEEIEELIDEKDGVDADRMQEVIRWVGIERTCAQLREEAAKRGWRLIEGVDPRGLGYVYLAELDNLTPGQQKAHGRQSCHAVRLEVALGRPRLTALCSNPARHRPTPTPTPVAPDADEEAPRTGDEGDAAADVPAEDEPVAVDRSAQDRAETRRREREEREMKEQEEGRNRKRVATARRAFLSDLIGKRMPKRADVGLYIFAAVIEKASQTTMAWVGKILGLEPVTTRFGTTDWHTPVVAYAAQGTDQLLKVVLLVTSHWAEDHVTQYTSGYDAVVVRHIELLGTLGYVPDPYETEQIAYHRDNKERAGRQQDDSEADRDTDDEGTEAGSSNPEDIAQTPGEPDVQDTGDKQGATQLPDESATSQVVNTES